MNESQLKFIQGLIENNLNDIRKVPKADLHNHGVFGGNIKFIEKIMGRKLKRLHRKLHTVKEMADWIKGQIFPDLWTEDGFNSLLESTIRNASEDGITILEMSIDSCWIDHFYKDNMGELIERITLKSREIDPKLTLKFELGIRREKSLETLYDRVNYYLDNEFFKTIDLYGEEEAQPVQEFVELYRLAKSKGLKLKAHVGEFGTPEDIVEAIEQLGVQVIQHGITAVESKEVMQYLCKENIQLNICPTSNVMLSRVKSFAEHPIKTLYDNGIKVTINSDDMLIFNSSVSEEFLKLYNSGLMSAEELNEIREFGLKL